MSTHARFNVLGVQVSALNLAQAASIIEGWVAQRRAYYVCVTNVHSVMECVRHDDLRALFNAAGMVTTDGMPLVWLGRLAGFRQVGRVYGPDLMLALCASPGLRHYFYGGGPEIGELLATKLRERYPGLQIAGLYAPPFRTLSPEEDMQDIQRINESGADIVWVGLGTGKQERWMAEHRPELTPPVLIGVGAAFDFLSGRKPWAPRWMQRTGLEWLFRLLSEPRRLWRRYLIDSPLFVVQALAQILKIRHY